MAGAGYRTFASGEVLTANNVQTYLMDQAVQVYSGTAARASAVPSPSTGMVAYATATGLQVFNGSTWVSVGGATYASISGGASTALGTSIGGTSYNVHTFTSDANLVVTTAGLAQVLLIGGGGGGGGASDGAAAGGGGGGGVQGISSITTIYLAAGTVAIDVGAGGAGGVQNINGNQGSVGLESKIGTLISVAGGGYGSARDMFGGDGASGGGTRNASFAAGKTVQAACGNNGALGAGQTAGGGGGGAGSAGVAASSSTVGGAGGNGIEINTFVGGVSYFAGAGGGGGASTTAGGAGSGGVAGKTSGAGNNGVNYGAAGGGSYNNVAGGAGAAGAVFVRVTA